MPFVIAVKTIVISLIFIHLSRFVANKYYRKFFIKFDLIGYVKTQLGLFVVKILRLAALRGYKHFEYLYAKYLIAISHSVDDLLFAAKWLEKPAAKGIASAAYKLAIIMEQFDYSFLETTSFDDFCKKINSLVIMAAESGLPSAQYKLGMYYLNGQFNLSKDKKLAHDWMTLAARGNNIRALSSLGMMYSSGDLGAKDYKKAYQFFECASRQGDALGTYHLASMYHNGHYIKKDIKHGFSLLHDAADLGSVSAMYDLAKSYQQGKGVLKDTKVAFEWYNKAASLGFVPAKIKLADMYAMGHGIKKNPIKAEYLLKSIAELGDASAQFKLGTFYDSTSSNLQDYKKAYEWYLRAAKQGHTKAQINLAALFIKGEGVLPSKESAKFWLELAAKNGDELAKYNLKQFNNATLEDFIAEALSSERVVH